jgi:hypothetical protein
MLVNRDESNPHTVRVIFEDAKGKRARPFSGPVAFTTFGREQYAWQWAEQWAEQPRRSGRAACGRTILGDPQTTFTLPKASITVLRGRL